MQHSPAPLASRRRRWLPAAILLLLVVAASTSVAIAAATAGDRSLSAVVDDAVQGERFSLFDFEAETVFNRWLGEVGAFVAGRRDSGADADRILERYFTLGERLAASNSSGDSADTESIRAERRKLENRAERILENRIADAFRAAGFSRDLPLFDGQTILWPPIDVELDRPPRVLVVSPRDEIRLRRTVLLDPGLSLQDVERIEAAVEADGRYSAFVDTIGGVAAYPAIVRDTRSYPSTVDTIAHEWVHHYLFFYPLGRAFFDSTDVRTINETVADIVAAEVARDVFRAAPNVAVVVAPPPDRSESDAALRRLRLDVDDLLAAGRVDDAERLMEQVRLELVALGRNFRRINQAFFAANGVYATSAASSSPIGPMLQQLRAASPTLLDFVVAVRDVEGVQELQALLSPTPDP